VPRRYRVPIASIALVAFLAAVSGASARTSGVVVVKPYTILRLAGTDMYCSVYAQSGTTGVVCLHLPGGPTSKQGKGYEVVATEKGVVVVKAGASKSTKAIREPSFASIAKIAGGAPHGKTVTIAGNDVIGIAGTHMAVYSTPKVGASSGVGVIYVDSKFRQLLHTYSAAITNKYVSVIELTGPSKTKVVYRHGVY
jgi:hypothetical protein